jgi:hypothetical protein
MKDDIRFYIYDENLGDWEPNTYTLSELPQKISNGENPTICPIKEDGQTGQPILYRQYMALLSQKTNQPAAKKKLFTYEVVTHNVYKKNKFDAEGFKKKLNALAVEGYRLVAFGNVSGVPESEEAMERAVLSAVFGGEAAIKDYKIALAIMEKEIEK